MQFVGDWGHCSLIFAKIDLLLKVLLGFRGVVVSARIAQNGISDYGSLLTKSHLSLFVLLSQTTKPSQTNQQKTLTS
jgi:hypothetical protein